MTYSIRGLGPERFAPLFALDDADLAAMNARRVTATSDRGFPCRISLGGFLLTARSPAAAVELTGWQYHFAPGLRCSA